MEISSLEERCARLSVRLKEETNLRQEGEEKAALFDRQNKAFEQLQKEHHELKKLFETHSSTLATLTVSEGASRTAERDSERAKDLLAQDKAYLSQELRASEARADQAAKMADVNASKVASLEIQKQALSDQLLQAQLNASAGKSKYKI